MRERLRLLTIRKTPIPQRATFIKLVSYVAPMETKESAVQVFDPNKEPHENIFDLIFHKDELTWQDIIYDLIRSQDMDPWDIDVSLLTHLYIQVLKKLKEADFRVSGKVLLASALLLKIKSVNLVEEGIEGLNRIINPEQEEEFVDEWAEEYERALAAGETPPLRPKTPQPRKRKVSIFDLIEALEKALEVRNRRENKFFGTRKEVKLPERTVDITKVIGGVYVRIKKHFETNETLKFSQLIPSDSKKDKINTFVPLIYLAMQRRIDLEQKEHFGEIDILLKKSELTPGS